MILIIGGDAIKQARQHYVMHVTEGYVVLAGDSAAMRVDVIDAQGLGCGDQRENRLAEGCQTHLMYIEMPASARIQTRIRRYCYFVPYPELCFRLCLIFETQPTPGDDSTRS